MMNLDRLLLRINAALDGDAEGFEARALAVEYATLTENVRERLRQCVALIKAGNDHAALQVAEAEPPVLDVASKLAFDRSGLWRDYCKANRFPAPARIEDRLVDPVNGLYSREVGESHPLYRDYRSAVRERDERRALGVLRSIVRINTSDRNARDEYSRLSAKLRREALAGLSDALDAEDTAGTLARMKDMESAGLGPCPGDEIWELGEALRDASDRDAALAEALGLLPRIVGLRDTGDTEGAIALLGRVRTLEKQYGFVWPDDAGKTVRDTERRMTELTAENERRRLEAERRDALTRRLDALEDAASSAGTRAVALAPVTKDLRAFLADAKAEPAFPEEELARAQKIAADAEARLRRSRNRTALAVSALVAASAGVVAGGAIRYTSYRAERHFRELLEHAEKSGAAGDAFVFLDETVRERPGLAAKPEFKNRIASLATRTGEIRRDLARIVEETAALKREVADPSKSSRALHDRAAALDIATETLPKDLRAKLDPEIDAVVRAVDERAIDAPAALLEAKLAKADASFVPDAAVITAIGELDAALKSPGTASEATVARGRLTLEKTRKHVSSAEAAAALETASREALGKIGSATTLEDYLSGVAALAAIPGAHAAAAAAVANEAATIRSLPAAVMPTESRAMLEAAKTATPAPLLAADATASESANAAAFAALARYAGVWTATRTVYSSDGGSVGNLVRLAGKPNEERSPLDDGGEEIRMTARILRGDNVVESVATKCIRFKGRRPSGEIFENAAPAPEGDVLAESARLFDPAKNVFTEAPLVFLDRVRVSKASPLLKAWLHRQIIEIVAERPGAWGVTFSPEFRADAARLAALVDQPLSREAWTAPDKYAALRARLAAFYDGKGAPYAPAAAARAAAMKKIADGGVVFAGYADGGGEPKPIPGQLGSGDLVFGLGEDGKPAILGDTDASGTWRPVKKPAAFSPLLRLAVSPDKAGYEGPTLLPKP